MCSLPSELYHPVYDQCVGSINKDSIRTLPGSGRWQQYASGKHFCDALERQLGEERHDLAFQHLGMSELLRNSRKSEGQIYNEANKATPRSSESGLQSVHKDSGRARKGFSSVQNHVAWQTLQKHCLKKSDRARGSQFSSETENNCSSFC